MVYKAKTIRTRPVFKVDSNVTQEDIERVMRMQCNNMILTECVKQ